MSKASLPQQNTISRWLKQHKFIIYQYGDLKSKIEVLAGMIFSETSPLGLQMATLVATSHGIFSMHMHP